MENVSHLVSLKFPEYNVYLTFTHLFHFFMIISFCLRAVSFKDLMQVENHLSNMKEWNFWFLFFIHKHKQQGDSINTHKHI